jgi:glycolate oxidase FAD binding subunit
MVAIAQALLSVLEPTQIKEWEALPETWQVAVQGAIASSHLPACIAFPENPEQLAAVVAYAYQNQWRLLPCGHGTKLGWGALLTGVELVISTERLQQVMEHAAGDLTLTVDAGSTFRDVQTTLQAAGQFLAIDPAYPHRASIGGIVVTRDTGALRHRYGGIRDMLIGVSFVRYDGQLVKAGGRVVKNVAGYDLMKLMSGSFGTLGIVTQLTFRTYPVAESSQTMILTGSSVALRYLVAEVLQSSLTPVAMDVLSPGLVPGGQAGVYGVAIKFQSIAAGVTEQVEQLQAIASPLAVACQVLGDAAEMACWKGITDRLFPDETSSDWAIAKLGILPAHSLDLLTDLGITFAPGSWYARVHASSGIGIVRVQVSTNSVDGIARVRQSCQAQGGYLNLLQAPTVWKIQLDPWALSPDAKRLMGKLQNQFDPGGRLSPGRFGVRLSGCIPVLQ